MRLRASGPAEDQAEKLARLRKARTPNPFVDPSTCRAYAQRAEAALAKRLAE